MKRILLKLALPLCTLLLASCLGDSKTEIKKDGDFCVIMINDEVRQQYASTTSGPISFAGIDAIKEGTAGYINYTISSWNTIGGTNIIKADKAEMVTIIPNEKMRTTISQEIIDEYNSPVSALKSSGIKGGEGFNDYWLWHYTATMKKSDKMNIVCFYDEDNQFDAPKSGEEKGEALDLKKDAKAIIDIRFKKVGSTEPGNELDLQRNEDIALVLKTMRNTQQFMPDKTDDDGYKRLRIKFRYLQKGNKETDKAELKYLGEWGGEVAISPATYYFIHSKDQ